MVYKGLKKSKKLFSDKSSQKDSHVEYNPLKKSLEQNKAYLNDIFSKCDDVIFRDFEILTPSPIKVLMVYVDGLTNQQIVSENVIGSLMQNYLGEMGEAGETIIKHAIENVISMPEITTSSEMIALVDVVLTGDIILLVDGQDMGLIISARGYESRNVTEPETETLVRGPRDGFTENLRTNTTLIRRRIKTSRLKFETIKVGIHTKTAVTIAYIEGIVNDKIVEEARKRISRIDTDSILESGYIEEFIEDSPWSIFPQMDVTERPDKVSAHLLEGHVAVLVDSTPFALLFPITFVQLLQSPEDYYLRTHLASFLRILRLVTLNMALLLPSFYIAITTFHQEMLPTSLLISIAKARAGVPFPAFVEALLMEISFEIVREAGVRLARPIGQAVSIVGALVIGQSAVEAGLVSSAMIIVVALTAMASFTLPSIHASGSVRLLRFPIMLLAASLGLFGVMAGLLAILIHLCSLRSFGIPYLSPIAPLSIRDLKDVPVRVPWWAMFTRPRLIGYKEPQRQNFMQMPKPPKKRKGRES